MTMRLDYKLSTLENGIRIATSNMPQVESVAVGVWVGVGGRYEAQRVSGISHFIEHLLFKGTETRSARQISEEIEGRGGYFNAFTAEEVTCYYARAGARYTSDVLEILSDMYRNPRFAAADIDRERGVIIEEIMMYRDQPQQVVQEMLGQLLWPRHPLGRPLIGTPKHIMRMTRDDILQFKNRKYVPRRTVVSLAGKVDHEQCVEQARRWLGTVPSARSPVCKRFSNSSRQERLHLATRDIEQSHLAMGIRLFGRNDRRRYALKLLSVMLGENMSSRLFQVVREKNGLAYAIHSSAHLMQETGALVISAGLERKRTRKALQLIVSELQRLKEKKMSRRVLRRAKDYAIGQMLIGLESTTTQMSWVGERLIAYDKVPHPEQQIRHLERVTEEDIMRLAGQILRARNVSVAMITPEEDAMEASEVADCVATLR